MANRRSAEHGLFLTVRTTHGPRGWYDADNLWQLESAGRHSIFLYIYMEAFAGRRRGCGDIK